MTKMTKTDPQVLLTAESRHSRIQRLTGLLPKTFPRNKPEEYMLYHHDVSKNNILVDENHDISGFIDWEFVHTVPLWLGCQIPKFLHSHEVVAPPPLRTEFRDERDAKDYWRHIEESEKTQLRGLYLVKRQRICSGWIHIHNAGALKADFYFAVNTVTLGSTVHFDIWLKQVKQDQELLAFRSAMGQV